MNNGINVENYLDETALDKTVRFSNKMKLQGGLRVTVFDGFNTPRSYNLDDFGKPVVSFGRAKQNDIVLESPIATSDHGRFIFRDGGWVIEDRAVFGGKPSTNGLVSNNTFIVSRALCDGEIIRIDNNVEAIKDGVLFVFAVSDSTNVWQEYAVNDKGEITIGRDNGCDITIRHISVSKVHAKIVKEADGYYMVDNGSTNGVVLNNQAISGKVKLQEKDVITITNTKLIFTSSMIYYCFYRRGITVDASDVVIRRGKGKKSFITCNHVNLNIKPGELVAIIGGSGAGKSTVLNCMCGYLKPNEGNVYINGIDLYENFDSLKKLIGYVPQSDIVYDNLTLHDMLMYTAKLRLPKDVSPAEREATIDRAIELVELTEKKNSLIRALSGGQRKRASIAVELLSDPNLLFLDEPASGLDPGTERNLMVSLRKMADNGKTVILVTHSTLQLKLCDKIVFMGKGGRLCCFSSYDEALAFFGVDDVVDVYNMITDHSKEWNEKYNSTVTPTGVRKNTPNRSVKKKENPFKQLAVLCARYIKLIVNDKQRLMLLLCQAPILALLISLVADGQQFEQFEMTKSLLFALSCSAFWIGMLNAIQEVCKERNIMKREYMTGLSLWPYISSKIIVLGGLCLIQSVLVVGVFGATVGLPEKGLMMGAFAELLITAFLTAISSAAMGLFVSSLFNNADRAMTVAPILLMPQILFSGLIFNLEGATEYISWFAVCRWSMEGLGTTANLTDLPLALQQKGLPVAHTESSLNFFEFTNEHMLKCWAILVLFTVGFLVLSKLVLSKVGKEKS